MLANPDLHGHTMTILLLVVAIQSKSTLADGCLLPLVANMHPPPSCWSATEYLVIRSGWAQDMHLLAERCILKGLKGAGVVTGDVEEMLSARVGALFMPHGAAQLLSCACQPRVYPRTHGVFRQFLCTHQRLYMSFTFNSSGIPARFWPVYCKA